MIYLESKAEEACVVAEIPLRRFHLFGIGFWLRVVSISFAINRSKDDVLDDRESDGHRNEPVEMRMRG